LYLWCLIIVDLCSVFVRLLTTTYPNASDIWFTPLVYSDLSRCVPSSVIHTLYKSFISIVQSFDISILSFYSWLFTVDTLSLCYGLFRTYTLKPNYLNISWSVCVADVFLWLPVLSGFIIMPLGLPNLCIRY